MNVIAKLGCPVILVMAALFGGVALHAQSSTVVLGRVGETIVLEPYAPNIVRVTLSLQRASALRAPGYGIIASPDAAGWSAGPDRWRPTPTARRGWWSPWTASIPRALRR